MSNKYYQIKVSDINLSVNIKGKFCLCFFLMLSSFSNIILAVVKHPKFESLDVRGSTFKKMPFKFNYINDDVIAKGGLYCSGNNMSFAIVTCFLCGRSSKLNYNSVMSASILNKLHFNTCNYFNEWEVLEKNNAVATVSLSEATLSRQILPNSNMRSPNKSPSQYMRDMLIKSSPNNSYHLYDTCGAYCAPREQESLGTINNLKSMKSKRNNMCCTHYISSGSENISNYGDEFSLKEELADCIDLYEYSLKSKYKKNGYLSGEKDFHKTVFDINNDDIGLLEDSLRRQDRKPVIKGDIVDAHLNHCVTYEKLTYANNEYKFENSSTSSYELKDLYKKIVANIDSYSGDKFMCVECVAYFSDSENESALGWHRDSWKDLKLIKHLGFCVLYLNSDIIIPSSKLKLGFIHKDLALNYSAESILNRCNCFSFESDTDFTQLYFRNEFIKYKKYKKYNKIYNIGLSEFRSLHDSDPEKVVILDDATGSGYLINQEQIIDGYKLIVHCREKRPYQARRLVLIIRCTCYDAEAELPVI